VQQQNNNLIMSTQTKAVMFIRKLIKVGNSGRETTGNQLIKPATKLLLVPVMPQTGQTQEHQLQNLQPSSLITGAILTGRLPAETGERQELIIPVITHPPPDPHPMVAEPAEVAVVSPEAEAEEEEGEKPPLLSNNTDLKKKLFPFAEGYFLLLEKETHYYINRL
jgi:hypothetical protein